MTIKALAQAKWRSSALTDAQAKILKLGVLHNAQKLNPGFHATGALKIPYFDLEGKRTKFYRIRYLEQLPGFAGLVEKPQRYDQPRGTLNEVYFPPLLSQSWKEISENPQIEVGIGEGELKSGCAAAHGLPIMGLGGVFTWKSSKNGIHFLPGLENFTWKDRVTRIVFDNDITHKIEVMRASRALALELLARGAKVFITEIPPGPAKGIDDYILAHGVEAFQKVLEDSPPFAKSNALWGLNEELVFVKQIDTVLERTSALMMKPYAFTSSLYANRFYMEEAEIGKGDKKHVVYVKTPLASEWLTWEHRAEVERLTYKPGQPKICDNGLSWNAWNGWGVEPVKGDIDPWKFLLDFVFQGDDKMRVWFERWCAYPLQHPGTKLYTAVMLWSRVKRLGKSMIAYSLQKIYGENAVVINSKQLAGSFNSWAKNRQLIIGEEITAGEARIQADWLKGIITEKEVTINEKNKPEYVTPDCMNHLYNSNHNDSLFMEDGDGRYMVHEILQNSPAPRAKYEVADKWLHNSGPSHLFHHLLDLPLGDFNPREHAPGSKSKQDMIRASLNDLGLWALKLKEDPKTALRPLGSKQSEECDLFTPEQLFKAYDPEGRGKGRASLSALGRALITMGFRQVNGGDLMQVESGIHRFYAVRNTIKWEQATRNELKEHYNKFFGLQTLGEVK